MARTKMHDHQTQPPGFSAASLSHQKAFTSARYMGIRLETQDSVTEEPFRF